MKKENEKTKESTEEVKTTDASKKLNDKYETVVGEDGIEILDESPKKEFKISSQMIIITLLSISTLLLGALVFVKRDAIFKDNELVESPNPSGKTTVNKSVVPVEDTYAFATGEDFGIQLYVLRNGKLYYKIYNYADIANYRNYRVIDFNKSASYDIDKTLVEYPALSGIKRIKTYNFSDSVSYSLLLIMEDGSVYKLTYIIFTNQFTLTKLNVFGDNKVDDIVNLNISSECISSNCAVSYEIMTKEGKKVTK